MKIKRYDFVSDSGLGHAYEAIRKEEPEGEYVEHEAHLEALAAKDAEYAKLRALFIESIVEIIKAEARSFGQRRQGEI